MRYYTFLVIKSRLQDVMRIKAEAPGIRRGIMLDKGSSVRIEALRVNTEAGSDSDVIRMALIVYAELVEAIQAGHRIIVRDGEDEDGELSLTPTNDEPGGEGALVKRNLMLHERTALRLDVLKDLTGLGSDSELVRQAVGAYALLVDCAMARRRVVLLHIKSKSERELMVPVSRKNPRARKGFNLLESIEL